MPFVRSVTEPRSRAVSALRSSGVITPNSSDTPRTPSTGASACATCCSKLERSGQPATVSAIPMVTSPPSMRTSRTMSSSTTLRFSSGSITCSSAFRIASRWDSIPRRVALDAEAAAQPQAVAHGVAVPVVVEVGVDLALRGPRLDALRPFLELALRVVAVAAALAVVEAQERPVDREDVRVIPARRVADHERDAVGAQQLVDLVDEPAVVAKLEAVPAGRELLERRGQACVIAAEAGRQLPEHRPQLRRLDQRADPLVEELDARRQLAEPLDVRRVAAHLHGEEEPGRRLLHPVGDRRLARQPVEGGVHLDGVEVLGIELEPAASRQPRWVEDAVTPVLVVPARAADPDRLHASAAKRRSQISGVAAATQRERPSMSSGAAPKGGASGSSIASPRSRTSSCAAAISTDRAPLSEQTASTRPAARWQSESASEPMIRRR